MKNALLIKIIILILICLLAPKIATFVSGLGSIVPNDLEIARIFNYSSSIRWVCLILSIYCIFNKRGNDQ